MTPLDDLPPDQRAVLSLLLTRGKSYDDLAGILHLEREAVRVRAHDALDALGPRDGAPLTPERRGEVADYLLGQQSASERAQTRAHLEQSASSRAWARVAAAELRPIAGDALPEIPAEGAEMDEAFDALQARTAAREEVARSSRLGGVLLLAGIGIVVAVVLVLILTGGGSSKNSDSTTVSSGTPTATQTTATTAGQPQILSQVNLTPPHGGRAVGIANLLALSGQLAIALQAQGLAPTTARQFYAVWLYNSASENRRLGFAPPVSANGRLQATATVTSADSRYHTLIVTRESARQPTRPGPLVLGGAVSIPSA